MRPEVDGTDFVKFQLLGWRPARLLSVKRFTWMSSDGHGLPGAKTRAELEMTRHISLRQLDPLALHRLKTTCKWRSNDSRVVIRSGLSRPVYAAYQERCCFSAVSPGPYTV